MELPANDVIKQGTLKFKGKLGIWNKHWVVLRKASSKGNRRLERYADEKSAQNNNPSDKSIDLHNVLSVQRLPPDIKKFALAITFTEKDKATCTFCCDTEADTTRWQLTLKTLCLSKETPAMSSIDLLQSGPSQKELTEVFHVYLLRSLNLAFYGECLLQVTQEYLHLLDTTNPNMRLVSWPLNSLRRYGSDDNKFTFESGRHCDTGEGLFIVTTKDGEAIYKKIHAAALAIAEMHRLMHLPHTHSICLPGDRTVPAPVFKLSSEGAHIRPRQPRGSALHSPLPPIPIGDYLECPSEGLEFNYDDAPPTEMAPPTPTEVGYLPMRDNSKKDEYVSLKDRTLEDPYLYLRRPPVLPQDSLTQCLLARQHAAEPHSVPRDHQEEYVYAEKGLTPAFRTYLKERKNDETE